MTSSITFMPQTTSAPVHAAKGNKKRTTKGGKKKEAAENAPIFLRSKFPWPWNLTMADRPFKQMKSTRFHHHDDMGP
jgi:hypothetical protein